MAIFKRAGFAAKEQAEVSDKDIKSSSLLILGSESPVLKRLFGEAGARKQGFLLVVRNNPLNASKVVAYAQREIRKKKSTSPRRRYSTTGSIRSCALKKGKTLQRKLPKRAAAWYSISVIP